MKYAILNVLLGGILISQAWLYRAWAVPLVWMGLCFCILGVAYMTRRTGLLGKRMDGTLAWWSWLLLLPLHLYVNLVWHLCRLFSKEPATCQLGPKVIVGRRLLPSEVPSEVECIVDLTAELLEPAGVRQGRNYRWFGMLDASVPDHGRLREFIASLPDDAVTYIHCAQGHGRTGLFTIAYLVSRGICADKAEAEALLMRARPGVRLNAEQRRFVDGFQV